MKEQLPVFALCLCALGGCGRKDTSSTANSPQPTPEQAAQIESQYLLPPNTAPERVTHKIAYALKADSELAPMITSLEADAPEVPINRQPAVVLRPPVRGEGWFVMT